MMKINDVRSAEDYNKFQCSHPIPTTRQIHHAYDEEKRYESRWWSLSDEKVFEEMMINRKKDNKRAIKQNDKKKSENKQRKGRNETKRIVTKQE